VRDNTVALTGTVQARTETNLSFRIDGRLIERVVGVGDVVRPGQLVARLDPENEESALQGAQAQLVGARARLVETRNNYERLKGLVAENAISRAAFESAEATSGRRSRPSRRRKAQVTLSQNRLSYTRLVSNVPAWWRWRPSSRRGGAGGAPVLEVANEGAREAVFDVPRRSRTRPRRIGDHGRADGRSARHREGPGARGVAAGRSGHRHVQGARRAVRRAARDAPSGAPWSGACALRRTGDQHPRSAIVRSERQTAVWLFDPRPRRSGSAPSTWHASIHRPRWSSPACSPGTSSSPAGVQALRPGMKVRLLEAKKLIGPNLSEWAIGRRSLVVFFMLVAVVAGSWRSRASAAARIRPSTIRTMVVSAAWPGASLEDTLSQVTERLERKLQETRNLDRIRSYTTAGTTIIFVELLQSTRAADIPPIWQQVRNNMGDIRGTLPRACSARA